MANNWDKMSRDDYNAIRQNKFNYHNTNDPALREIYHNNNSKIRERYGMTDADDISLGEVDSYIAAAEKKWAREDAQKALLTNLTDYAQNGNARLNTSADKVRNFNYNPSADPSYSAYVDMYNRQGQSAAKQTLNNLNAANMGRNSSYGAAATAQVQQAYAQKASEMIPTLAEQAYNKLLNQYNVDRTVEADELEKYRTAYNTILDTQRADSELKYQDAVTRQALHDLGLDEKFAYDERAEGLEGMEKDNEGKDLANDYQGIVNEFTPGMLANEIKIQEETIEGMGYDNEEAKLLVEALPQQLKDEATQRALNLTTSYWNNVGLSAEAREKQVAADIAEQFGIPMAAAQYITTQAEATIAQATAGNIGTKIALENQAAGANIAAVQADTAYTKANTGLVTAKTDTENVTNGSAPVVYTTTTPTPTPTPTTTNNYTLEQYTEALKNNGFVDRSGMVAVNINGKIEKKTPEYVAQQLKDGVYTYSGTNGNYKIVKK